MKNLLLFLAFSVLSITANAQYGVENIFRKYKNDSGVIAWQFDGDISSFFNREDGEEIKSSIESIDFFMFTEEGGDINEKDRKKLQAKIKSDKFEMLVQARDKGQKVKIMGIDSGDSISKVFAQVTLEKMNVYFFLTGELFLEDLQHLEIDNLMNGLSFD